MATNNQDSEYYYYGDGYDDGLSNDFDQSQWQSQSQGPQAVVSPQLQALAANLAAHRSPVATYDDTPDWGEGPSRQAELAGTFAASGPAFPAYPDGASLNSANWEAEGPSPNLDDLDDLTNQMRQQHLDDNFATGTENPWAGQEHYEETAPNHWEEADVNQYTGGPSYAAGTDDATEAWQDPNYQAVHDGIEMTMGGYAFQLGRLPGSREEVVVREGSPLAGNTPDGSPRPSAGDAPTGSFMVAGTNRTLFQRLAGGAWEIVTSETTRTKTGYTIAATAEMAGRMMKQPMAVASGNATALLADMYNTARRLGNNIATRPVDMLAAAEDAAELVAQGFNVVTGFQIAASAGWQQTDDGRNQLVFDGEGIQRAAQFTAASAVAFGVSSVLSGVRERRDRHERDRPRGDIESRGSVSERRDDRRDDRGHRDDRRDDRGHRDDREHRGHRDERRDDREHRGHRDDRRDDRREDREHRGHRGDRRERTYTSTSSVAGMSSPYAEHATDDRGESSSMSSGSHHSRQRKNKAKAPARN